MPVIDLLEPRADWRPTRMPGSDTEVGLVRLHLEPVSRATVSLVEFPALWRRAGAGHYVVAEEFVVLRGTLMVSGVEYAPGDYALLPAGALRVDSRSSGGCLALAAFSGPPGWVDGESGTAGSSAVHESARRAGRLGGVHFPGDFRVVDRVPDRRDSPADLLSLDSGHWCFLQPGDDPPRLAGPVAMRTWPVSVQASGGMR